MVAWPAVEYIYRDGYSLYYITKMSKGDTGIHNKNQHSVSPTSSVWSNPSAPYIVHIYTASLAVSVFGDTNTPRAVMTVTLNNTVIVKHIMKKRPLIFMASSGFWKHMAPYWQECHSSSRETGIKHRYVKPSVCWVKTVSVSIVAKLHDCFIKVRDMHWEGSHETSFC